MDSIQEVIDLLKQLEISHQRLKILYKEQESVKKHLTLFKFVKIFKERNDSYYVKVAVTKDPIEAHILSGIDVSKTEKYFAAFLVIGIVLPTIYHYSLVENNFNINFCVECDRKQVQRQVVLSKLLNYVVIPWPEIPINSELDISIFGRVNRKLIAFRIPTIVLNISYFLRPLDNSICQSEHGKYKEDLVEMSRLYSDHKKCYYDDYKIPYIIFTPNVQHLITVLLKNSAQQFVVFEEKEKYEFEISLNTSMSSRLTLIKKGNFIEIVTDIRYLYQVKKYLIDEMYFADLTERRAIRAFVKEYEVHFNKNYSDNYQYLRKFWRMI